MKKIAIVSTHPIQYNVPLFQLLAARGNIQVKVFYTWSQTQTGSLFDRDFGKDIAWDIPLMENYDFCFVPNISKKPGSYHFRGIINPGLNKAIEDWKADAILIFGWKFKSHLGCMRYFHNKIPVLFRGDSTLLDEQKGPGIKKAIKYVFLRWVFGYINTALYVGSANKAYFRHFGLKEEQLLEARAAIDNQRFGDISSGYETEAASWRKKLGIEEQHIVFLFAGKLVIKKNVHLLLAAFMKVANQNQRLIIVGNGILELELKRIAAKDNRIIFIDFQNQKLMPVIYRLGDVLVLPSFGPGETWGLAMNEAMACGRPVIASDRCGAAYDLITEHTGWMFKKDDEQGLEKIIQICQSDSANLKEKGRASNDFIQNFSFQNIATVIESFLCNKI